MYQFSIISKLHSSMILNASNIKSDVYEYFTESSIGQIKELNLVWYTNALFMFSPSDILLRFSKVFTF